MENNTIEQENTQNEGKIGATLKAAREAKGITLDQVAEATSIRRIYLDAVENNDFTVIPGAVYIKGILRTYGNYLGLDGVKLVEEFKIEAQGIAPDAAGSATIREAGDVKVVPSFKPSDDLHTTNKKTLVAVLLVIIVCLFAGSAYYFNMLKMPVKSTAPAPTLPAATTPVPAPAAPGKPAASPEAQVQDQSTAVKGQITLKLEATSPCWLSVEDNMKELYQGTLNKGDSKTFTSKTNLTVTYGNVKGVKITLNGKVLPVDKHDGAVTVKYDKPL